MRKTDTLHDLVAQLHDIGNSLDLQIDAQEATSDDTDGRYMGHTAKYWHGQFRVKDRRCERLSIWKREHSNAN